MIRPPRTVTALGATGAAALAYGVALARDGSVKQDIAVLAGLAGLVSACIAWKAADAADAELEAHPALMNGYFLTGGQASALSDNAADVGTLRGLMGVPTRKRRGQRANHLR